MACKECKQPNKIVGRGLCKKCYDTVWKYTSVTTKTMNKWKQYEVM
jgi:hypothetical protein